MTFRETSHEQSCSRTQAHCATGLPPSPSPSSGKYWAEDGLKGKYRKKDVAGCLKRGHQHKEKSPLHVSSGDGKGISIKGKTSRLGRKKPVETPLKGQGRTQEDLLVTAELQEEASESSVGQGMEPLGGYSESGEHPEGFGAACINCSAVDTDGAKASTSKCGRGNHRELAVQCVFKDIGKELKEGPVLLEKIQLKSMLDKHQGSHMEEKDPDCPNLGVRLYSHPSGKHQILERSLTNASNVKIDFLRDHTLLRHQKSHTGKKSHQCPVCGRNICWKSHLLRYLYTHSGEKPHKCPNCGKGFSRRSNLLRHQKIHMGRKPH